MEERKTKVRQEAVRFIEEKLDLCKNKKKKKKFDGGIEKEKRSWTMQRNAGTLME